MKSFEEWLKYQQFQNLTADDLAILRDIYAEVRATADAGKPEDVKGRFCDLATQYYVAGRSAAIARLTPVHGNLLHHAVEMFLKTALVGRVSLKELKDKYRHDLVKLWHRFNVEADPALNRFDATVRDLHEFEQLRYPDQVPHGAILLAITWQPGDTQQSTGTMKAKQYEVIISDLDRLVFEIMKRISMNPRFFTGMVGKSGREALRYQNPHAEDWLTPESGST